MTKRLACVCIILLSATSLASAQSTEQKNPKPPLTAQPPTPIRQQQPVDLKTDLDKMQVLIEQMQRNVAFVSAGDTPLKHQFQLEIEMWQLLLKDMDRKIDETGVSAH